jgi:hypothetical protein
MSRRSTHRPLAVIACLLGLLAPVLAAAPASAAPMIRIVKIHYRQTGTNLDTEYLVLKNTTGSTIHLSGWKIISAPSSDNQNYVFPATTLGAGKTLTLYTGHGTDSATKRYWNSSTPRWDNDGDKALLRNTSGTLIDSCTYAGGGTTAYC